MVKYYGRARQRIGSVNTNQIGLKMSGCPSKVGRQGYLSRYIARRAQCNLKYCGPVFYHGIPWSYNTSRCVQKVPRGQSFNSGVGHKSTPRFACNINCSGDKNKYDNIVDSIRIIRHYFINAFGEDGLILIAPQKAFMSSEAKKYVNEKIYYFSPDHKDYYTLPKSIKEHIDHINNFKLEYKLDNKRIQHIVGYISSSLQKKLKTNFYGIKKYIFRNENEKEIISVFASGNYKPLTDCPGTPQCGNVPGSIQWAVRSYFFPKNVPLGIRDEHFLEDYGEIECWDTSNVTDMSNLLAAGRGGTLNESFDLSKWDTSKVTDMSGMFDGNSKSNPKGISKWNVGKVTDMSNMFRKASFFNQNLNNWNVRKVQAMTGMFRGASSFNEDISNWEPVQVQNMDYMFNNAFIFNKDISNWPTGGGGGEGSVNSANCAYEGATNLDPSKRAKFFFPYTCN